MVTTEQFTESRGGDSASNLLAQLFGGTDTCALFTAQKLLKAS